jgi:hypothetical protein
MKLKFSGVNDEFSADIAARAGPVLDDERLAEFVRQFLGDQPRDNVGRIAGWKADNDADRPRRIGLGGSNACYGR